MTREDVMQMAQKSGLVVEPCADKGFIGIRSYQPDTNERMRIGASGEIYTRGDDGWMYQIGTIDDVASYVSNIRAKGTK